MIAELKYYSLPILNWIKAYYGNEKWLFLILALIAFVYLFITRKNIRYNFLTPIGIMMLVALNPILYKYIFIKIIYWRLLWMFPSAILIALATVELLKQVKKTWMKWGFIALFAMFIFIYGEDVFKVGGFIPTSNWEKLSQETIDVCDIMLALEETPRAVVHSGISTGMNTEVRQYAPQISLMYGREVTIHIRNPHEPEFSVYKEIKAENPNWEYVLEIATEYEYDFFVLPINLEVDEELLSKYGYEEAGRTKEHVIYYNPNAGEM